MWITKLFRAAINKLGWIVTGYLGDVAIYTTTDEKSKYYRIRQQILNESQTLVEALLDDDAYDRVIIAGHSLGSVIAYDTLDRINIKANLREGKKLQIQKLDGTYEEYNKKVSEAYQNTEGTLRALRSIRSHSSFANELARMNISAERFLRTFIHSKQNLFQTIQASMMFPIPLSTNSIQYRG